MSSNNRKRMFCSVMSLVLVLVNTSCVWRKKYLKLYVPVMFAVRGSFKETRHEVDAARPFFDFEVHFRSHLMTYPSRSKCEKKTQKNKTLKKRRRYPHSPQMSIIASTTSVMSETTTFVRGLLKRHLSWKIKFYHLSKTTHHWSYNELQKFLSAPGWLNFTKAVRLIHMTDNTPSSDGQRWENVGNSE